MGGRKISGLALPDFQYRHAIYVINRWVICLFFHSAVISDKEEYAVYISQINVPIFFEKS